MSMKLGVQLVTLLLACAGFFRPALAQDSSSAAATQGAGALVSTAWLRQQLASAEPPLLLDAQFPPMYAQGHIPGAVPVDVMSVFARNTDPTQLQQRLQSWGVNGGNRRIVVYDQGASFQAPRVLYELHYAGVPLANLALLDGGLAKWQAEGGAATKDASPAPTRGNFRVTQLREDVRVRLNDFLAASGDPARHSLVEALEPTYHFGENRFFDRAGHVPNAVMWQNADFFNADKTFKSPAEIRRMADYLGIKPEQEVLTHCGGGGAAAVPWFALKAMLGYPRVKLYRESQFEWLQDERQLPFWTYDAPQISRDATWLSGWNNSMLRAFGFTRLNVIDVRGDAAYLLGHVPFALPIGAETFSRHARDPLALAALLGPAGVNPAHEVVIVSAGGVSPDAALAFALLENLGHKRVSILMESMDEWGLRGHTLAKAPTIVGAPKSAQDLAVPPARYAAQPQGLVLREAKAASPGAYPIVYLAAGAKAPAAPPAGAPAGAIVHVPHVQLLNADGTPKAAKDLWSQLSKAGVPRYARIVCIGESAGEAAVAYYVLRLMGYPDVRVLLA
jgi:3-mercaptopyruvate sulfurtransferase SseA